MRDLPNLANVDCVDRVNRAIDHVTRNLDQPLKLEDVARVACFSSFHFHRVFRVVVGETLAQFVKRVRLERAVYLLSYRPGVTVTEVALACGFSSSSDFSRSFRAHYGVPPRRFSIEAHRDAGRRNIEALFDPSLAPHRIARLPPGANPDGFSVRLRDLPARRVAYTRVHRPYEGERVPSVAREMLAWARERGVSDGQWLGYQWDDPEIVALEHCRYDVGLEIPRDLSVGGEVSITELPAMKVAEVDVVGPLDLELRALDWLYASWLPTSGWAPDHQPVFEAWNGEPFAHGMTHFELRVQLAVVDAALPP